MAITLNIEVWRCLEPNPRLRLFYGKDLSFSWLRICICSCVKYRDGSGFATTGRCCEAKLAPAAYKLYSGAIELAEDLSLEQRVSISRFLAKLELLSDEEALLRLLDNLARWCNV